MTLSDATQEFWKAKAEQFDGATKDIRHNALKTLTLIALSRGDKLGDVTRDHLRKTMNMIVTTAAVPHAPAKQETAR